MHSGNESEWLDVLGGVASENTFVLDGGGKSDLGSNDDLNFYSLILGQGQEAGFTSNLGHSEVTFPMENVESPIEYGNFFDVVYKNKNKYDGADTPVVNAEVDRQLENVSDGNVSSQTSMHRENNTEPETEIPKIECVQSSSSTVTVRASKSSSTPDVRAGPTSTSTTNRSMAVAVLGTASSVTVNGVFTAGSVISSATSTAVQLGSTAMLTAGSVISSVPVIGTLANFATQTVLFSADRASTFVDRCVIDLSADTPEVIHLRELGYDTDWRTTAHNRTLLPTLGWTDRQLLHETRGRYSTVRVGPLQPSAPDTTTVGQESGFQSGKLLVGATENEPAVESAPTVPVLTARVLSSASASASHAVRTVLATPVTSYSKQSGEGEGEGDEVKDRSYVAITGVAVGVDPTLHCADASLSADDVTSSESSLQHWLASEAAAGDEEAQYALSRWCSRPTFRESAHCSVCSKRFGVTLFRHHCRRCGQSFCGEHSAHARPLPQFGIAVAVRLCDPCVSAVDREVGEDLVVWRVLRVRSFLAGTLIPYFSVDVDRRVDKAIRLAEGSLYVVQNTLSLNYYAKLALQAVDLLSRYGMSGLTGVLLRKDFVEAAETLKRVSMLEAQNPLSLHELTACIYYKLALDRGLRGCDPEAEHCMHQQGAEADSHVSDSELDEAIRFAPFALSFIYEASPTEMQRLVKQQGYQALFIHTDAAPEKPAFALFGTDDTSAGAGAAFGREREKVAILAIRGTASLQDVVTDCRTLPQRFQPPACVIDEAMSPRELDRVPSTGNLGLASTAEAGVAGCVADEWAAQQWEWDSVPEGECYVCGGVFRAALWVLESVGPALLEMHRAGYKVVLTGHSLGAAVATLLVALLRDRLPGVRCWAYGCPSCVDASLADALAVQSLVTSVVLQDDVIPRFTPNSIRALMKDLLVFRERVFRYVEEDWSDVLGRASQLWSPRWRSDASPKSAPEGGIDVEFGTAAVADEGCACFSEADAVQVSERVLADVWLPGRVLHVYACRGVYKLCAVPRSFRGLRCIAVQGNIFENHKSRAIMDALLEVRTVRRSLREAPEWTPFHSTNVCQRCQAAFTWHTTCQGRAQDMRERHNCRCCGALVCGPCSQHREVVPAIGLRSPARICDACFYSGAFAL